MVIRFRPDMSNYPKALAGYQMKTNRNVFIQSNNFFGVGPMMPQPPKIGFWGGFGVSLGTALNYLFNRGGFGGISAGSTIAQGGQGGGGNIDKDIESLNNLYGNKYKFGNVGGKVSITDKDGKPLTHGLTVTEAEDYVKNHQNDNANNANNANKPSEANNTNKPSETNNANKPSETNNANKPGEANNTNKPSETNNANKPGEANNTNKPSETNNANKPGEANNANNARVLGDIGKIPTPPENVKKNAAKVGDIKKGVDIEVNDYKLDNSAITGAKLSDAGRANADKGNFPKSLTLTRDGKSISYNFVQVEDGVAVYKSANGSQTYFLQKKNGKLELMQPNGDAYTAMGAGSADNPRWHSF